MSNNFVYRITILRIDVFCANLLQLKSLKFIVHRRKLYFAINSMVNTCTDNLTLNLVLPDVVQDNNESFL